VHRYARSVLGAREKEAYRGIVRIRTICHTTMPTYEYVCKACGNSWEANQRISEAPLSECPKCHEQTAQRLISGGNFILKGGGWYSDLYSSTPKKSGGSESSSSTKTETKSETKSDTSSSTSTDKK
jgi:putative FmdB family regulatory protein